MKNIILIIFLFVTGGKFHQVTEHSPLLGFKTCGFQVKKSDKSPVFFTPKGSNISKPKKRKPKGVEIKTIALNSTKSSFAESSTSLGKIYYSSPELIQITNWVPGRAPPLG